MVRDCRILHHKVAMQSNNEAPFSVSNREWVTVSSFSWRARSFVLHRMSENVSPSFVIISVFVVTPHTIKRAQVFDLCRLENKGLLQQNRFFTTISKYRTNMKKIVGGKRSSLSSHSVSGEENQFLRLTPGANVIKLFTSVLYECS